MNGSGAVGLNSMMEDAATAEISRVQLWTWMRNKAINEDKVEDLEDHVVDWINSELRKNLGHKR